jgi:tripartite-type tricarboxylate transporter receptor subunit TctC
MIPTQQDVGARVTDEGEKARDARRTDRGAESALCDSGGSRGGPMSVNTREAVSMHVSKAILVSIAALVATLAAGGIRADPYPTKAVRYIVAFAPGGLNDIVARLVGQKLSESWKQPVVVDNRAGSAGNIGADIAAKAPADGYTMLNISLAHAINATLYRGLPYDVIRDFAPVTLVGSSPLLLAVYPGLPVKSVSELVAYAKSHPLNFGSGGAGAISHLAGELFRRAIGANMAHVPYKGGALAANDLMGGQIQLMFNAVPELIQFVKAGRLRALAVTSRARYPLVPELPTMIESGFPGFEAGNWIGIVVPAATPRPVVNKLSEDIVRVVRMPEIKEKFSAQGIDAIGTTPEEFGKFLRSEAEKWGKVVREVGARAD